MIEFVVDKREGQFYVTSPQLPGWKCGGFTRVFAVSEAPFSLREYLLAQPILHLEIKTSPVRMVGNI